MVEGDTRVEEPTHRLQAGRAPVPVLILTLILAAMIGFGGGWLALSSMDGALFDDKDYLSSSAYGGHKGDPLAFVDDLPSPFDEYAEGIDEYAEGRNARMYRNGQPESAEASNARMHRNGQPGWIGFGDNSGGSDGRNVADATPGLLLAMERLNRVEQMVQTHIMAMRSDINVVNQRIEGLTSTAVHLNSRIASVVQCCEPSKGVESNLHDAASERDGTTGQINIEEVVPPNHRSPTFTQRRGDLRDIEMAGEGDAPMTERSPPSVMDAKMIAFRDRIRDSNALTVKSIIGKRHDQDRPEGEGGLDFNETTAVLVFCYKRDAPLRRLLRRLKAVVPISIPVVVSQDVSFESRASNAIERMMATEFPGTAYIRHFRDAGSDSNKDDGVTGVADTMGQGVGGWDGSYAQPDVDVDWKEETSKKISFGCLGWRATLDCDGSGERDIKKDLACDDLVDTGDSGFCQCMANDDGGTGVAIVGLDDSTDSKDNFSSSSVTKTRPSSLETSAGGVKADMELRVGCHHRPFRCGRSCRAGSLVFEDSGGGGEGSFGDFTFGGYDASSYHAISRHYRFALSTIIENMGFKNVVVLEDDLNIADDMMSFFEASAAVMAHDKTVWAASAFNDQGLPRLASDTHRLWRSDFFGGLGWLMTAPLWAELGPRWPEAYWDDWMRHPDRRRGRTTLRPELSRTTTRGDEDNGASQGQFGHVLNAMRLPESKDSVDFQSLDLSYLEKDRFDASLATTFENAQTLNHPEEALRPSIAGQGATFRILYESLGEAGKILSAFGGIDDAKAGVPRGAYQGVIPLRVRGNLILVGWKGGLVDERGYKALEQSAAASQDSMLGDFFIGYDVPSGFDWDEVDLVWRNAEAAGRGGEAWPILKEAFGTGMGSLMSFGSTSQSGATYIYGSDSMIMDRGVEGGAPAPNSAAIDVMNGGNGEMVFNTGNRIEGGGVGELDISDEESEEEAVFSGSSAGRGNAVSTSRKEDQLGASAISSIGEELVALFHKPTSLVATIAIRLATTLDIDVSEASVFDAVDVDGNGVVDARELMQVQSLNLGPATAEKVIRVVSGLGTAADQPTDGDIEVNNHHGRSLVTLGGFTEWLQAGVSEAHQEAEAAFAFADLNNNGWLSLEELVTCLEFVARLSRLEKFQSTKGGIRPSGGTFAAIDNKKETVMNSKPKRQDTSNESPLDAKGDLKLPIDVTSLANSAFALMDTNEDGTISQVEFITWFSRRPLRGLRNDPTDAIGNSDTPAIAPAIEDGDARHENAANMAKLSSVGPAVAYGMDSTESISKPSLEHASLSAEGAAAAKVGDNPRQAVMNNGDSIRASPPVGDNDGMEVAVSGLEAYLKPSITSNSQDRETMGDDKSN